MCSYRAAKDCLKVLHTVNPFVELAINLFHFVLKTGQSKNKSRCQY